MGTYATLRPQLRSGDLIFLRENTIMAKVIRAATRSDYCHCGVVWIAGERVFIIEARFAQGVTMRLLSEALPADWIATGCNWTKEVETAALSRLQTRYSWLAAIAHGLGLRPRGDVPDCSIFAAQTVEPGLPGVRFDRKGMTPGNLALAGAIALACILAFSLTPAAAQSALEWAASQGAQPAKIGVLRNRGISARNFAQSSAPLDIRSAPQIVADASRYIGTRNPMRFRGPGCKVFLNMVARRSGYYANASARAFDTRGMGQRVSYPQPGDYRVSARRGGGHAELVASVEGGRVITINGNKGGNRVGWSHRSIGGAAYYRPIRMASAS